MIASNPTRDILRHARMHLIRTRPAPWQTDTAQAFWILMDAEYRVAEIER